jgi:26S proteasome regulatory subunit T3
MDRFDQTTNIKVIMATNRADTGSGLVASGRLDRRSNSPTDDKSECVFQAATSLMNLSDELDLEDYVNRSEKVSAADISSICSEAGLMAVRRPVRHSAKDFDSALQEGGQQSRKGTLPHTM